MNSDKSMNSIRSISNNNVVNGGFYRSSDEMFQKIFDDGMQLVEETAAYLDGIGREESKRLDRGSAMAYATQSMRLTTKLMQIASWLLVQRAVRDGDMTLEEANDPQYQLSNIDFETDYHVQNQDHLPEKLSFLISGCEKLFDRINRLQALVAEQQGPVINSPARAQQQFLKNMISQNFGK